MAKKITSPTEFLKRLEGGYSLPTLSVVALKLVELASDDTCSARDLADLIKKDPSLAVRLLKLANSALFQSRKPVSTLEQAVIKVGFHRLRIMALSLSLRDTFPMGKVGTLDYEGFWRSSLYRALMAKALAQHLRTCDPEEAFVAGLILEIGLLILFDLAIKGQDREIPDDTCSLEGMLAWEMETFGIDHRQVGEVVLRFWKFPEGIIACQGLQGGGEKPGSASGLAQVCELARELSENLFKGSKDFDAVFSGAARHPGLNRDVINDILASVFDQVKETADQLRLELDRAKDLMGIMEKANRALGEISEKMSDYQERTGDRSLPSFESLPGDKEVVAHTLQAVAHEIRNPLLAVGGFAKKLASALDPSSDTGKYVHIILEEASRLEKALTRMTSQ